MIRPGRYLGTHDRTLVTHYLERFLGEVFHIGCSLV